MQIFFFAFLEQNQRAYSLIPISKLCQRVSLPILSMYSTKVIPLVSVSVSSPKKAISNKEMEKVKGPQSVRYV